jgi:glycosyltransferase involved in cell wall biosynthesis
MLPRPDPLITVITPTTGRPSLARLIESLRAQSVPYLHILLWDDKRHEAAADPASYQDDATLSLCLRGRMIRGKAAGSALRAVGLMAANTEYVTFADDDVWFEGNHFSALMSAISGKNWAFTLRKLYSPSGDFIGVDRFESVGDASRRPYQMVDNSSNMFKRVFGVAAAQYFRETEDYNDDRLMYEILSKHAGPPGKTGVATVNQVCPPELEDYFRRYCGRL